MSAPTFDDGTADDRFTPFVMEALNDELPELLSVPAPVLDMSHLCDRDGGQTIATHSVKLASGRALYFCDHHMFVTTNRGNVFPSRVWSADVTPLAGHALSERVTHNRHQGDA